MKKICISKEWFLSAPGTNGYIPVDLPNDYAVTQPRNPNAAGGGHNGYFEGGSASYVKHLKAPENAGHWILDIDGAYMHTEVVLNEDMIARHPHGYTPLLVDLTPKLRPGHTNKLKINTMALHPSTRWYSGAGIYRDVFLWTGGEVRVEPRDIFITTESVEKNIATVRAAYTLTADIDAFVTICAEIPGAAEESVSVSVKAGEKTETELLFRIENPKFWDTEHPNLYLLKTEIAADGKVTDTAETKFGIRTISADAEHGFLLNGKPMKLRGGCIHHDHGVLGAAAYPAAERRKISRLKALGFNALRIAHNPPSLALLEACDEIGMIVIDEAFDMWNEQKTSCDYHLWFADWWARDISYMVLRDRNHPCVIAYSIGNEILERSGRSDGALWSEKLTAEIRKYDATRFVTSGICGMWDQPEPIDPEDYKQDFKLGFADPGGGSIESSWDKRTEGYMKPLDIVGYNYFWQRYEYDHKNYPNRVIWGSETFELEFYDSWHSVLANSHVIGDFTWTAQDYLGEAGIGRGFWSKEDAHYTGYTPAPLPWRTSGQGDLDLCGYRRPVSYFREAVWIGGTEPHIFTTHPEHYGENYSGTTWHWYDVLDTWTFEDRYLGKPVKCDVYTDADEIEWSVNGRILGRSKPEKGIATMDVPYEKGEIRASAYKDGVCVGTSSLHTVGTPAAVNVKPERTEFSADRRDLCYFDITVTDPNGERVPDAKNELICIVDGGELLGIFSGDPMNYDEYTTPRCHAFEGRALAIVRTAIPGKVTVTVGSPALTSGIASAVAE